MHKKTNSAKCIKKPQKPNKIKASLARLNQFIKAKCCAYSDFPNSHKLLISAAVALHKTMEETPKSVRTRCMS